MSYRSVTAASAAVYRARTSGWMGSEYCRVESVPPFREGEPTGSKVVHKRQSRVGYPDDVAGDLIIKRGEHRVTMTINTQSASGSGLVLGVASLDGCQRWGVKSSDGRLKRYPESSWRKTDLVDQPVVMLAPGRRGANERAINRRVEVIIDMARRRLLFSVDGATAVDAGLLPDELPAKLVCWAQLFYKGDSVTITHHRSRHAGGPQTPSPVRVPPSRPFEPLTDAGPWTP